ncbi:MAG: hypothetical protein MUP17_12530 [candidate division Zixibacteria bacterium]|nr:hypothetical protein [candidate division Zixibacteria bacterium]
MRNLKPADKNGGESSNPIFMPNQVEPQIRHKTANKKEGRKLLLLAEEEFIRLCLFERYNGGTLVGLIAQRLKRFSLRKHYLTEVSSNVSGIPTLPARWEYEPRLRATWVYRLTIDSSPLRAQNDTSASPSNKFEGVTRLLSF